MQTKDMPKIVGVVRSPELHAELTEAIANDDTRLDLRVGELKSLGSAVMQGVPADVLVLDIDIHDDEDMAVLERLTVEAAGASIPVLATAKDLSAATVRRLVRTGVADVIPQPIDRADLSEALRIAAHKKAPHLDAKSPRGRLLTFSRATGGAGATTLAVNVAHALARRQRRDHAQVCLIDLDLHFGTVALQLDLSPTAGLLDIAGAPERLDRELLVNSLVEHPSGLRVLTAPNAPMPLEALSPQVVTSLLDLARAEFDYVVVDLPVALTAWTETVFTHSDRVFLVTELNVPAVRQLRKLLDIIEDVGLYNLPVQLVLNRLQGSFFWGSGIKRRQAEKALGRPFDFHLADQLDVLTDAANRGCPVFDVKRYSRFCRQLRRLIDRSLRELTAPSSAGRAAAH